MYNLKITSDFRMWIPEKIREENNIKRGDFLNLHLKKNEIIVEFIVKFNKSPRFHIPKTIRKELEIEIGDIMGVLIKKVHNRERKEEFIKNGKIDLLAFIPTKTSRGYEIVVKSFAREGEEWLKCWYHAPGGRPKPIRLRRFVPPKTVALFGYLQAEGAKIPEILPKRRGLDVAFSNKLISLHKEFVSLAEQIGIPRNFWSVSCRYNSKIISEKELEKIIDKFSNATRINKENISTRPARKVKRCVFDTRMSRTILAEILNNGMDEIRKRLVSDDYDNTIEEIAGLFFSRLLSGDGSIQVWIENSSLHTTLLIYEGSEDYVNDYAAISEKLLGKKGKIKKLENKKMRILTIYGNWDILCKLYKINAFFGHHKNRKKLIYALKVHNRTKSFSRLKILKKNPCTSKLKKFVSRNWIRARKRENYIKLNDKSEWKLTQNGQDTINLIESIKRETTNYKPPKIN